MNIVNHAAVGAVIGMRLHPALAVPAALLSHFALDAVPHYGFPGRKGYGEVFKHKFLTSVYGICDVIGLAILIFLLFKAPAVAVMCGIVAALPDLLWVPRYYLYERKGLMPPGNNNPFIKLHRYVQWCERPWGLIVEVLFSLVILYGLWRLV